MDSNEKSNFEFIFKTVISVISLGIVPIVKTLHEIWVKNAPEREAKRAFRLERLRIKNMSKEDRK